MPGTVTLIGSGETTNTGGQIFDALAHQSSGPLHISVLETPAGFEANSERVAGRISEYLAARLQNYQPQISQLAARKKGTQHSPDSPEVTTPLYESSLIFLGPGSPTYAVRQLQDSLAWNILQARHRLGASLVFASAAAVASGALALPVYEIYKVGDEPHWKPGLDFFGPFGLALVVLPHWNNQDGGAELDTSRCFMGLERFERLLEQLPAGKTILGIDELTAVTIDFETGNCQVAGTGSAHLLSVNQQQDVPAGSQFPLQDLGDYHPIVPLERGLPGNVWQQAQQAADRLAGQAASQTPAEVSAADIPRELKELVKAREKARQRHDWPKADKLREQIAESGWEIIDSPDGPLLRPLK